MLNWWGAALAPPGFHILNIVAANFELQALETVGINYSRL